MHNIPLNVVSRHLRRLCESKEFDVKELDARLQSIPWSSGKSLCFCNSEHVLNHLLSKVDQTVTLDSISVYIRQYISL